MNTWVLFVKIWGYAYSCGLSMAINFVSSSYHQTSIRGPRYLNLTIQETYRDVESLLWCAMLASNVAPGFPFRFHDTQRTCFVGTAACVKHMKFPDFCWIPSKASHVSRCHYRIQNSTGTSWKQAQSECHKLGGYLPEIESDEEFALVTEIMMKEMLEPIFIGGKRVGGKMEWSSGAEMRYTAWYTGYPTDRPDSDCVLLWAYGWTNNPCDHTAQSLLCEFDDCIN